MYIPDILQQLIESFNNQDILLHIETESQSQAQAQFNENASDSVKKFYEQMGSVANSSLKSLKNVDSFQFRYKSLFNKILVLDPVLLNNCFSEFKYIQGLTGNLRLTDLQISQVHSVLSMYFTNIFKCATDVFTYDMFLGIRSTLEHSIDWETEQFNRIKGLIPNISSLGYLHCPGMNLSNMVVDVYKNCSQEQLRIVFMSKINYIYSNPNLANLMICDSSAIVNLYKDLYAAYITQLSYNWNVKWETCIYIFLSGFLKYPIDTINILLYSLNGSLTIESFFSSVGLIESNTAPTGLIQSNPTPAGLIESGTIESNPTPAGSMESNPKPAGLIGSNYRPAGLIGSNITPTGSIGNNPIPRNLIPSNPTPAGLIGYNEVQPIPTIDTAAQRLGHPMTNFREDLNSTDLALDIYQNRRMSAKDLNSYLNVVEKTMVNK